jgi:hypothetical protein
MSKMVFAALGLLLMALASLAAQPGDIVASHAATDFPTGLAWDGQHLWLADRDADWLYAIEPTSGARVDSVGCPAFFPTGLAYGDGCLWVSGYYEDHIYKIDLGARKVTDVIDAPGSQAYGLAWYDGAVWAVDGSAREIVKLDTQDGTALRSIKSPSSTAHGLAADETYIWVSDRRNDKIYMVEPERGWVVMIFDAPGPYARGLAWDGARLWNVDYQTDSLYALAVEGDGTPELDSPKKARVKLRCKVRCEGPDPIEMCDVYLALPHDHLPHQNLLSEITLEPETYDLTQDKWGQRFVHFTLTDIRPGETARASYEVQVEIQKQYQHVIPERVGDLREIPRDLAMQYTVDGARLAIDDPVIRQALAEAVGDETNPYWIVRRIFHYVNDRIEYERVGGWDTAPNVLTRGKGSCSEYSFVFMALARAAGIPTRFCAGVVERGDEASMDDVFHRWTEVYLPNYGWIPVDTSAGDSEWQADAMKAFGSYANRILITTIGGGDSKYVGWGYNYGLFYNYSGRTSIDASVYADWDPIE